MPCALHARRVFSPLTPVDLVYQRHVADGDCPRPRRTQVAVVCSFVFGECRNRDCDAIGEALVVVVRL